MVKIDVMRTKHVFFGGANFMAWFLSASIVFSACAAWAGENEPVRVPWTASHVSGSPEPPSPYETQRIFPKLTFDRPLDILFAPGTNRIVVAQEKGRIFSFPNDPNVAHADIFFDPTEIKNLEKVPDCKGVDCIFAVTFHPQYQQNHYCYIQYNLAYYTRKRNHKDGSRVSRFVVTQTDPPKVDTSSEVILFDWLSGGHNGCSLKFGPDNYLYISLGDGADPDPPDDMNTGQDISDLLSSVLRIDVDHPADGKPYSIPSDNPFITTPNARPEVYAYGLRNPFRMNFDSKTGNLWLCDVGWELYESVHCIKSGGNYGWSIMEGPNPVHPNGKRGPTEIIKPLAALTHAESCSITGGLVYRGKKLSDLYGYYLFGDWQTSRLWAAKCIGAKEDSIEPYTEIAQTDQRIVAFCEDPDHEPMILDHGAGGIYRLVRNPMQGQVSTFPKKLSDTGVFASVKDQTPAPGVLPFSINAPQWVDGASAERWVATPGVSKVTWGKGVWGDDKPAWPKDSVLVRTLALETSVGDPSSKKRVETQLLHFDGRQWRGYSYAWNDAQTDADLIPVGGDERPIAIADPAVPGGTRRQMWHFASRTQCMTCHNVWCDYALSFNAPELDRAGPGMENQVRDFRKLGLLLEPLPPEPRKRNEPPPPPPEKETLSNPYDDKSKLSVAERARSYLHVNCPQCHRFGGGGTALIDVRKEMHTKELKAIGERPALGEFGLDGGKLIFPGDPNRSVLLYRTSKLGRGRMPHIGSDIVDEKGTELLRQWISSMDASKSDDAVVKTRAEQQRAVELLETPGAADSAHAAAADQLLSSTSGALLLLGELQSGKIAEPVRAAVIAKAIATPLEPVRDLFRKYDPRELLANRLGTTFDRAKLLAMPGDAARGRKLFFDAAPGAAGGMCARCHRINGQGTEFGPDLSHIGTKYNKALLLENVVEPSKTIAEGFTSYLLRTVDGQAITGLLVSKSDTEVVLKDVEKQYHVKTADVKKLTPQTTSMMPEGMLQYMSPQEAADLMEYLSSLK